MMLVEVGELVVLDMAVFVGFLGESALDDRAKNRGSVLHSLEEGALSQLCFRLAVVDLCWTATAEGLAEACIKDAVANGA